MVRGSDERSPVAKDKWAVAVARPLPDVLCDERSPVAKDKWGETVTLQNVSPDLVDLTGWNMCSVRGNQFHPIAGVLAPGQSQVFPGPAGNIWNNSDSDPGALYNPEGRLVSYYPD